MLKRGKPPLDFLVSVGMMRFQKIRGQAIELSQQRKQWAITIMEARSQGHLGLPWCSWGNIDGQITSVLLLTYTDGKPWPPPASRPEPTFRRSRTSQLKEWLGLPVESSCIATTSVHRGDSSSSSQSKERRIYTWFFKTTGYRIWVDNNT